MGSTKSWLKSSPELLVYLFLFLIPLTHPAVRVLAKLIFLLALLQLLRRSVRVTKEDGVALLFPTYQLLQSAIKQRLLLFLKVPQGITPVLSYFLRFLNFSTERAINSLLYGTTVLALAVTLQSLLGAEDYRELLKVSKLHLTVVRPWHTFVGHPLTAGALTSVAFFISSNLFLSSRKVKYLVIAFVTLTATVLTFDRSYWVGLAATSLITGTLYIRAKKVSAKRVLLFGAPLVVLVAGTLTVPQLKERLVSIADVKHNGSNRYRLAMWKGGIEFFYQSSPEEKLLGTTRFDYKKLVGPFVVKAEKELKLPPTVFSHLHNDYITVLVWYGVIGLVLFTFFFGYFLYRNLKLFRLTGDEIWLAFLSAYLVLLIGGLFEYNFEDESVKYLIYSLTAVNVKLIHDRENQSSP